VKRVGDDAILDTPEAGLEAEVKDYLDRETQDIIACAVDSPLQPAERLYPLIWWGFWVNAVTGTALLMASASTRLIDPTFYIKMIFIFAGLAVLQLARKRVFRKLGPGGALPESAKALAWAGLICWLGAITAGRLLAYI
jgi:hypothetical protein